jgi:tRNA(Ile)-lysidine synthase
MSALADTLFERVAEFITRTSMANDGDRIGVAVSGGADSVVLLHLLDRLRACRRFELVVVHVNHRLRGRESDLDEQFVRALAGRLELSVIVESAAVPVGDNLEQAARDQRREFFARLRGQGTVKQIAVGHTMSDQAETVLFRMIRGTGLTGLAGMLPVTTDGLIRPLLEVTRDEVRAFALTHGLTWREDASNEQRGFRRNLIRLEWLPMLREAFHDRVEQGLANMASLAQAEEDYWGAEAKRLLSMLWSPLPGSEDGEGMLLDSAALMGLHLAARRRVVRQSIETVKGDLKEVDSVHIDAILKLCETSEGHNRVQVPGIDALRSFDRLRITKLGSGTPARHYRMEFACNQHISLPFRAGELELHTADTASDPIAKCKGESDLRLQVADFDAAQLALVMESAPLLVRNWEPGDGYRRAGHSRPEKVKALFLQERVYLWERRHWPVLEANSQILWVKRFGPAADFAATDSSPAVVRLSYYKRPLPDFDV